MNRSASLHLPYVIQSRGRLLDLTEGVIMGILNVTQIHFMTAANLPKKAS